jgi:hypothetical protein
MSTSPPSPPPTAAPATATPTETPDEKWKRRQFYLGAVSAAGLIVGGLWSVYQYIGQQKKQAADLIAQQQKEADQRETIAQKELAQREELAKKDLARRDRDAELRQREINLMLYREKKEAYLALMEAAVEVATAKGRKEVEDRAPKYFGAYYGRVHIIPELDDPIIKAKNEFAAKLREYLKGDSSDLPYDVFSSPLNSLATACQKCLDCRMLDQKK